MGCYDCYFFDNEWNCCTLMLNSDVDYMNRAKPIDDYNDCDRFELREVEELYNETYEG